MVEPELALWGWPSTSTREMERFWSRHYPGVEVPRDVPGSWRAQRTPGPSARAARDHPARDDVDHQADQADPEEERVLADEGDARDDESEDDSPHEDGDELQELIYLQRIDDRGISAMTLCLVWRRARRVRQPRPPRSSLPAPRVP